MRLEDLVLLQVLRQRHLGRSGRRGNLAGLWKRGFRGLDPPGGGAASSAFEDLTAGSALRVTSIFLGEGDFFLAFEEGGISPIWGGGNIAQRGRRYGGCPPHP